MTNDPQPTDKTGPKPAVPYTHLWVDDQGVSHQSQCVLTD
jgi:hypothetical protein